MMKDHGVASVTRRGDECARLTANGVTRRGKLVLLNQGGVCGLMQQRSFGVRRFDVNRHERLVAWCYAESSLTNCHLETGVRHYRMQTHVHRTCRYVCMYGVRVLVSRSPSVVNLSLYRLCSARRARLGFDCAAV